MKPGRIRYRPVAEYLVQVGAKQFRTTFSGRLSEDDLQRIANVPFSVSANPTLEEARHHIGATLEALNLTTVARLAGLTRVLASRTEAHAHRTLTLRPLQEPGRRISRTRLEHLGVLSRELMSGGAATRACRGD